jgi:D-tyrosyl-tRNA(Tyr) deacylase
MRVVVQRVKEASCTIDGNIYSSIDKGFLLLVGFTNGDSIKEVKYIAKKIAGLRVFEDENGKMNLNLASVNGQILSISQFTLYADTRYGNRPSFTDALNPSDATSLYDLFNAELANYGYVVKTGIFGADMKIGLINDGPVTIIFDEKID